VYGEIEEYKAAKGEMLSGGHQPNSSVTATDLLRNKHFRRPLLVAVMLMLAQQMSGINAIIFFSTGVFADSGLSTSSAQYATLGMGGANVVMTLVSIAFIDRAGRKTLMLVGLVGMLFCSTSLEPYSHLAKERATFNLVECKYFEVLTCR
jgi:SP family facilitated glucose transporter-like MFS transporter 1